MEKKQDPKREKERLVVGDRVLCRWRVDGFYYAGQVMHHMDRQRVLVCLDMGILQNTERHFLITEAEASSSSSKVGKHVLLKTRPVNGMPIIRYVPAILTFQKPKKKPSKIFTVTTYREKQLRVSASDIVTITESKYNFILKHLARAQKENHEIMYGPEAYLPRPRAITPETPGPSDPDRPEDSGTNSPIHSFSPPDSTSSSDSGGTTETPEDRTWDYSETTTEGVPPSPPETSESLPSTGLPRDQGFPSWGSQETAVDPPPEKTSRENPGSSTSAWQMPSSSICSTAPARDVTGREPKTEDSIQQQRLEEERKMVALMQEFINKLKRVNLENGDRGCSVQEPDSSDKDTQTTGRIEKDSARVISIVIRRSVQERDSSDKNTQTTGRIEKDSARVVDTVIGRNEKDSARVVDTVIGRNEKGSARVIDTVIVPSLQPPKESLEQVLVRNPTTGWYSPGRLIHNYNNEAFLVQTEDKTLITLYPQDIIQDSEDKSTVIQEGDAVVCPYPMIDVQYCPAVVLQDLPMMWLQVQYYDGTEGYVAQEETYVISDAKKEKITAEIISQEEAIIGRTVVARNDKDGRYYIGTVAPREWKGPRFVIEWTDGSQSIQLATHMFAILPEMHNLGVGSHVLAVADTHPESFAYMPGMVMKTNNKEWHVQFINGQSALLHHRNQMYRISEKYYKLSEMFFEKVHRITQCI